MLDILVQYSKCTVDCNNWSHEIICGLQCVDAIEPIFVVIINIILEMRRLGTGKEITLIVYLVEFLLRTRIN